MILNKWYSEVYLPFTKGIRASEDVGNTEASQRLRGDIKQQTLTYQQFMAQEEGQE